ncbi:MAG: hypothetical protein V4584_03080 [Verrucomicrobiota bacterium]
MNLTRLLRNFLTVISLLSGSPSVFAEAEWQWSVADGEARAYLWIPPDCQRVRGLVFANHNMVEQGILEHPLMRRTLAGLGFAEVWTVPCFDATFDFNKGAGERFEKLMGKLAEESGYQELCVAPVVPLGHSACATFPWNFAAWNPGRTLAVLSFHGDAPRTTLTGNGAPRVDWGNRNIDGIPGLMVMGEYEWGDIRLSPAFDFMAEHPKTPLAFLADSGRGHFDYADRTVEFLAMFIRKAAAARLPADAGLDRPVELKPINPASGWRVDRWRKEQPPIAPAAPFSQYTGDPKDAFWCFDEEMAKLTEAIYARERGKMPQLLSVTAARQAAEKGIGEPVTPQFIPQADGTTFRLKTDFFPVVPADNGKATLWTGLPAGSLLGHSTAGPVELSRIVGPVVQTGPETFALRFGRAEFTTNRRNNDMWLVAAHPGDEKYKSMVQQLVVRPNPNKEGQIQKITFPGIADQELGVKSLKLMASSDAGVPVSYYVREGPAEVEGDTLKFTAIPPRANFPVKVTIVAWQWGRASEPKIQTAGRIERTFRIVKNGSK